MSGTQRVSELLVRAADAGDTYLSWTWLDGAPAAQVARLNSPELNAALTTLRTAMVHPQRIEGPGPNGMESDEQAAIRAFADGAFASRAGEAELAARLADAVLPPQLRAELVTRAAAGPVRIRVTPSPRLAQVPWELLCVDADRRLLDLAVVTHDPPATLYVARSRRPDPWEQVRGLPPAHIIDPILPASARHRMRNVYVEFADHAAIAEIRGRVDAGDGGAARTLADPNTGRTVTLTPIQGEITRVQLAAALSGGCSRLFYFGHVSAVANEPGSAAIHLNDVTGPPGEGAWGLAAPWVCAGAASGAVPRGTHLPLCALDLLLGTSGAQDPRVWARYGAVEAQPGHEIWRMPTRVAIIACEGGIDFRSAETFGLIMAALDAGAEVVTTTRWVLPTDAAFRRFTALPPARHPTTELALRVDAAHGGTDPIAALTDWQRGQLRAWRDTGDLGCTPLLWASLTTTLAPADRA
ncbi:CHAT domain-containing protein [Nocardia sp. NPDC059240]|uniref:CHAT domain-containing protein n=1 Tax=Nocardia sp. NPDC059240 TaxID=3346786 RepID=UPI0036781B71